MLWFCADNSSYQGCSLPDRPELYEEEENNGENSYYNGENSYLNEENALPSNDVEWGQDSTPSEFPKPVTDEAEWSDGWRSN